MKRLAIHDIHPYFAHFAPEIPRMAIEAFTTRGQTVLDPFCGSGTTLVEATVLGRNVIGNDANPLAALISRVKTRVLTEREQLAGKHISQMLCNLDQPRLNCYVPEIPNIHYWFEPDVIRELATIRASLESAPNVAVKEFLQVAFSRIITHASNQSGESRYVRIPRKHPPGESFRAFHSQVLEMLLAHREYGRSRKDVRASVLNEDSRALVLEPESVDLAVTSPPYLNSWDYGLYHRFRLFWLGFDGKTFYQREIGMHLRGQRAKGDIVNEYRDDMRRCLGSVHRSLRAGCRFVLVNGPSIVNKKHVDTSKMLADVAESLGYSVESILLQPIYGPHHGMRASLGGRSILIEEATPGKRESILTLRKAA